MMLIVPSQVIKLMHLTAMYYTEDILYHKFNAVIFLSHVTIISSNEAFYKKSWHLKRLKYDIYLCSGESVVSCPSLSLSHESPCLSSIANTLLE